MDEQRIREIVQEELAKEAARKTASLSEKLSQLQEFFAEVIIDDFEIPSNKPILFKPII